MTSEANQNKVAFITGANKGIGFETARQLGELGITVVLGSRSLENGKRAADQLKAAGLKAEPLQFDIINHEHHQQAYTYFQSRFGKLDILVNNAGMSNLTDFHTNDTSTVPLPELREVFETNFFQVVALTQKLLPLIRKSPAGRIVNVSSILGSLTLHADPSSGIYSSKGFAYNASKTALNAFTIHLAAELEGTNIKVNSAHPGWVKTDLGTSAAPMETDEGAKTSVQLSTLGPDGPNGRYFHAGNPLPW